MSWFLNKKPIETKNVSMIFKNMFFHSKFIDEQFLVSCMSTVQFFFLRMAPFGGKGTTQSGHAFPHIFCLFSLSANFVPKANQIIFSYKNRTATSLHRSQHIPKAKFPHSPQNFSCEVIFTLTIISI